MIVQLLLHIFGRHRMLVSAVMVALAAASGLYVSSSVLRTRLDSSIEEWGKLRTKLAVMDKRDATAIYRQGLDDIKILDGIITSRAKLPSLLGTIVEEADSRSVDIGAMSYRPKPLKDEGLMVYDLKFSVSGNYAGTKGFLSDMLALRDLSVVESVQFVSKDPFEEDVTMELQMSIYLKDVVR